ncbi:hypothetical protein KC19_VG111200 [Ceratodon purpureus]|uniref:Uncharacterized protein n=1 Tax=Ceratodon purpureus TaxID=3225 RepID=A0A8T0HP14_CERPU|nr:hypothetical protein KC19_VG111200 [Ceratodon purpureus]
MLKTEHLQCLFRNPKNMKALPAHLHPVLLADTSINIRSCTPTPPFAPGMDKFLERLVQVISCDVDF